MKKIRILVAGILLCATQAVLSADYVQQRYINRLAQGGVHTIKQVSQSIYNTGERSHEVLDVLAEVLLTRYELALNNEIDTLAWAARALGNSRDDRYFTTLHEITENRRAHRKLRKYTKVARNQVGGPRTEQYQRGMVNLQAIRDQLAASVNQSTGQSSQAVVPKPEPQPSEYLSLTVVKEGMSMPEVYDLVGHPTATVTHQTGKAWIPFNFSGSDLVRTIALYRGQGRVVFSHNTRYDSSMRVLEVVLDPNETGYP